MAETGDEAAAPGVYHYGVTVRSFLSLMWPVPVGVIFAIAVAALSADTVLTVIAIGVTLLAIVLGLVARTQEFILDVERGEVRWRSMGSERVEFVRDLCEVQALPFEMRVRFVGTSRSIRMWAWMDRYSELYAVLTGLAAGASYSPVDHRAVDVRADSSNGKCG